MANEIALSAYEQIMLETSGGSKEQSEESVDKDSEVSEDTTKTELIKEHIEDLTDDLETEIIENSVHSIYDKDQEVKKTYMDKGEPTLHTKMKNLIKLSNVYLNHAPNHEKFGICQRIRNIQYEIFELIVETQKRYHKKTTITNLDIKHEQLRMLFGVYFELGYFKFKHNKRSVSNKEALRKYQAISIMINEIGRMIGGWKNKIDGK